MLGCAANRAGDLYQDPEAQAKLQQLVARGASSFQGVVDSFLVGYAEGKNEEIQKAVEEEIEKQRAAVDAIKAAAAKESENRMHSGNSSQPTRTAESTSMFATNEQSIQAQSRELATDATASSSSEPMRSQAGDPSPEPMRSQASESTAPRGVS